METVIRKIRPGHPEASKTMSLDEAITECDDIIRDDRRSITQLKCLTGISMAIVIVQVIAYVFGAFSWITIPSVLMLTVASLWGIFLIRKCKVRISRCEDHKSYFRQSLKGEESDSE